MKKMLFTIDGFSYPHIGYTAGNRWNGWATPYFEVDEAFAIMGEYNKERPDDLITYDEAGDTFMLRIADDEIEMWKGVNYQTDEGMKHLYGIGAYSWVWENVTKQDIHSIAQRIADLMWENDTYLRFEHCDAADMTVAIAEKLQDLNTLKPAITAMYVDDLSEKALIQKLEVILNV